MKNKIVLWGTDAQNAKVLIALELRANDNKVDIFTFPEATATSEFTDSMMGAWRNGETVEFPEGGYTHIERDLTAAESLLPEELKADRADLIQRAQNEWHFAVLSSKLHQSYQTQLDDLKEKVAQMSNYDGGMWDGLKSFWDKVQEQVRERNLYREHADTLRDGINDLFTQLKEMRTSVNKDFEVKSQGFVDSFSASLGEIEQKMANGVKFPVVFDALRTLQSQFREATMTKEHRSYVWSKLDGAFKTLKGERFGPEAAAAEGTPAADASPTDRIDKRLEGLNVAIDKMQTSITRDREDLDFQNKKIASSDGQLEAQIRQAKIKMIRERVDSKQEKLNEMVATRDEVLATKVKIEEKAAKRAERFQKPAEAVAEVAPAAVVEEAPVVVVEAAPVVAEAAPIAEAAPVAETTTQEKIQDAVEDTVDTVKAVAAVAMDKVSNFIEELTGGDDAKKEDA
jgi:hypothetical protein